MMGIFDIVGTTGSGWLSDRFDSRWLLFCTTACAASRSCTCRSRATASTASRSSPSSTAWTGSRPSRRRCKLTTDAFGKADAPVVFGWILTGHQIGAAVAAYGAGWLRSSLETYLEAFIVAGVACVIAAAAVLWIGRGGRATVAVAAPA